MVHTLTPIVVDYINVPAPKIEIKQPSVEKMRQDIAGAIREFLINPEQCTDGKWAADRFGSQHNDEYIRCMAGGFQDWFHDMYEFVTTNSAILSVEVPHSEIIHRVYASALKNAIDIFGAYALEQQAIYVTGALFTVIKPTYTYF